MNAIRQNLKELKPVFEELPLLKKLLEYAKNILVVGCILWVLGGLIPDTAHFAVTFFSSIGRVLLFTGLFFALVRGDEDRFIMGASIFISIFSFIIIII